jgi:L-threonylcarbamoyladenylate synthase
MSFSLPIDNAARILLAGGIVAYPTEGVYGLGCLPGNGAAVARILSIKGRSATAGLILISPDYELLDPWIDPTKEEEQRLRSREDYPITWIVTAAPSTPEWLTGGRQTLAVRISEHPVVAALCTGAHSALVSTSANRTGRPAATQIFGLRKQLGELVDCIVPGPLGKAAGPSEIRIAQDDRVIRPRAAAG